MPIHFFSRSSAVILALLIHFEESQLLHPFHVNQILISLKFLGYNTTPFAKSVDIRLLIDDPLFFGAFRKSDQPAFLNSFFYIFFQNILQSPY